MMLFEKAVRWGYSCGVKCLSGSLHAADVHLFRKMANKN